MCHFAAEIKAQLFLKGQYPLKSGETNRYQALIKIRHNKKHTNETKYNLITEKQNKKKEKCKLMLKIKNNNRSRNHEYLSKSKF